MTATDESPKRRGRPPSGRREAILEATLDLLRERGIAKLTSRDIAARAGVSDASVYYHFGDRPGLMRAVYEHGMKPLTFMSELGSGMDDRGGVLNSALDSLEEFFGDVLPVLYAAQADPELGAALGAYVEEYDLGPHKGVATLSAYLRAEQAAGRANPEADVEEIAMMLIDHAFGRAARAQMMPQANSRLPPRERLLSAVEQLLR